MEIYPDLLASAKKKLTDHALNNINYFEGDAANGWQSDRPYDAIMLTGSVPILSDTFVQSLNPGGRLVAIIGQDPIMEATLIEKMRDGSIRQTSLFDTSLPPLINAQTPPQFVF